LLFKHAVRELIQSLGIVATGFYTDWIPFLSHN